MKQRKRKQVLILVFLVFAVLCMAVFWASSAYAGEATSAPKKITFWYTLKQAGAIGVVIILLSVAGGALVITFFVHIRRDELVPPDLLEHISELFENESYDEALEVCENNPCWLSNVMAAGLRRIDAGYDEIEKSMREASEEEAERLNQRVGYLNLIANVAPMLGLLGTVYGMILAFNTIAGSQTQPKPSELAKGISMALVTTFLGLLVAIPIMAFYVYFRNQITNAELEIGAISEELMEKFRQS